MAADCRSAKREHDIVVRLLLLKVTKLQSRRTCRVIGKVEAQVVRFVEDTSS